MSVTRYRKGVLSVPKLYVEDIDTRVGNLTLSRLGTTRRIYDGSYNSDYQHIRLITGKSLVDNGGNTLLDPDDSGGITTLADVASATTIGGESVVAPPFYGSANKKFVPCVYVGEKAGNAITTVSATFSRANTGATELDLMFLVPLPTTLYGLKMYLDDIKVDIISADINDYVFYVHKYGRATGVLTAAQSTLVNWKTAGTQTASLAVTDMSSYLAALIDVDLECTDASGVKIGAVEVEVYYDS